MGGAEWSGARRGDMGDERQGVVRRGKEGGRKESGGEGGGREKEAGGGGGTKWKERSRRVKRKWEVVERERADGAGARKAEWQNVARSWTALY